MKQQNAIERQALLLFRETVATVPAYAAFLREQDVDPASVQSFAAFCELPPTTKDNYVRKYPLQERLRSGAVAEIDMFAVSSGSTGQPVFWPRAIKDEASVAARIEQVLVDHLELPSRRTLAVICFPLGMWVGGVYTLACCRYLARKGYPLSIVAPGNKTEDIHRIVTELGSHYEQIVLMGYPPYMKDVIDKGVAAGVDWSTTPVSLLLAGEVFSEEWRDLVAARLGRDDPSKVAFSLYGTADAGILANETTLSIAIRRFLASRPAAASELFGQARIPSLFQYDPSTRLLQTEEGRTVFSAAGIAPLVRYDIGDTAGTFGYEELIDVIRTHGYDPPGELTLRGERAPRRLPFVYVFGRTDFTVSYFGANIYPENITVGLEREHVSGWVTGKFVLEVIEDADRNKHLHVTVELAPGTEESSEKRGVIEQTILNELLRLNSEFAGYVPEPYQRVRVSLLPAGDAEYFPVGIKHRYTRKP